MGSIHQLIYAVPMPPHGPSFATAFCKRISKFPMVGTNGSNRGGRGFWFRGEGCSLNRLTGELLITQTNLLLVNPRCCFELSTSLRGNIYNFLHKTDLVLIMGKGLYHYFVCPLCLQVCLSICQSNALMSLLTKPLIVTSQTTLCSSCYFVIH